MRIGAGELTTSIAFLTGTAGSDGAGGTLPITWTTTTTLRGLVKYTRAAETTDAQRVQSLATGEVYVRKVTGLTTAMRMTFDGMTFIVQGLIPVESRYWRIPFEEVRD